MCESAAILAQHRRARRRSGMVALFSITVGAVWAAGSGWATWSWRMNEVVLPQTSGTDSNVIPLSAEGSELLPQRTLTPSSRQAMTPLDESVFATRLWVPPPRSIDPQTAKHAELPPPPPPPPFKLRLTGLHRGEAPRDVSVLVYDPDTFTVTRLARGASIGRYTLDEVDVTAGVASFSDAQYPGRPRHVLKLATLGAPRTQLRILSTPEQSGGAP